MIITRESGVGKLILLYASLEEHTTRERDTRGIRHT